MKYAVLVAATVSAVIGMSTGSFAQERGGPTVPNPTVSPSQAPVPPPASGPIELQAVPVSPQVAPVATLHRSETRPYEQHDSELDFPTMILHQWSPAREVPPESLISEQYLRTQDTLARKMSLKEVIYVALRNNPSVRAAGLTPIASQESVRSALGAFDPNLTAQGDIEKSVTPATSILIGATGYVQKYYDWDAGINKLSALTNGTLGITFDNERYLSNSSFASINPSYTPSLVVSLNQPLLQNFGWQFATINVDIAESQQKTSQWNYAQTLQDTILRIAGDYWNVVLGEENLAVARAALKFNQDLVRQNAISVKVGTLAPLDLQEAESAAATSEANVYTAEANLKSYRAQLREDVMYNPQDDFMPANVEPSQAPDPHAPIVVDEERSLELAAEYLPSLAGMREMIRSSLLQVRYAENQMLPSLNVGAQIGVNSVAGGVRCNAPLGTPMAGSGTCTPPPSSTGTIYPSLSGTELPFTGRYGSALNRLWGFSFYDYAGVLSFSMPLDDAAPRAALAQARIEYEQQRMNYRAALSQAVVGVENAIANIVADQQSAFATERATYYAQQALHDENVRFRVGMATTHDLLQFQEEEVSAEGNQVQAFVNLENAKINLHHSQGTLLNAFNVDFRVANPHETPWYAMF